MSQDFESQVIDGIATLKERQTNQHAEVIQRLDTANGRLSKHDEEIKELAAHKNLTLGWVAAIGSFITVGLIIFEYIHHVK